MNFDQIISEADKTADKRKKVFQDLKKEAPAILRKYGEAMKALGYTSTIFTKKLFLNQAVFPCHPYDEDWSAIKFSFDKMVMTEATREEMAENGKLSDVFDGEEYPLDFSTNTSGKALLEILEKLPVQLKNCIEAQEKVVARVECLINS